MRLAVPLAVLGVLGLARTAHASPTARLEYLRSPDATKCPDRAWLRSAVAEGRGKRDPFVDGEAPYTFIVHIGRTPTGYAARVEVADKDGIAPEPHVRTSDGEDSCPVLVRTIALDVSLALDALEPPPSPQPSPVAESSQSAEVSQAAEPAKPSPATGEATTAPPMVTELAWPPPRTDDRETPPPRPSKYWSAGADAVGGIGMAPTPNAGIEAFVARRLNAFSLEVGLRADMSFPKTIFADSSTELGRVQSARFALVVAPCAHLAVAYACPLAEVGWVQAWISGTAHPHSPGGALVAAGARIGVDLPLSPSFDFRVYADAIANLDRAVFVVDSATVWTEPLFAAVAGVGIAAAIP